ncbi:MAG: GNAT family N-acetyltransferase [Gammaproteobacteria bacterium]
MQPQRTELPTPGAVFSFRESVREADAGAVREIVAATGFFNPAELDIAMELVTERLGKGPASGYQFILAEYGATLAGYACFGPISGTLASFDLYWIAVSPHLQGRGLGRVLLARAEQAIAGAGGRRVYVETSSRTQYAGTRGFYIRSGYREDAVLRDFYAPCDDKVIYVKQLDAQRMQP